MTVTYYYDNAGQLDSVTTNTNGDIIMDIDYSSAGAPTEIAYYNGVTTVNTYDPQQLYRLTDRLTTHNTDQYQDISYEYDPVGNITDITDASDHNGAKTAAYGYDDLYRLTSATVTNTANSQDYTHEYTYDIIGNVLTRTDVTGTYVYEGNNSGTSNNTMANPHAVTGIDTTTYSYDNNGNLTSDGTWTYTWNQKNWLTGAADGATTLDYLYDESGERAIKNNQTTSTQSRYINKYYELDATVPQTHVYAGDMKAATVQNGTDVVFHHSDHLTGTNVDTDESGAILEVLDYYPYGNVRLDEQSGSYENPYKYTGKELDEETDLYYYGARYYNANIGRFVSQDPWGGNIKDPQSFNKYSYALNNPMKYTDPTGSIPDPTDAAALACGPGAGACFVVKELAEYTVGAAAIAYFGNSLKQQMADLPQQKVEPTFVPGVMPENGLGNILKDPVQDLTQPNVLTTPAQQNTGPNVTTIPSDQNPKESNIMQTHGNDLSSSEITWGYSLRDRGTGEILKYGQTINPDQRYSQKYLDSINAELKTEVSGSKKEMRNWETEKINEYKKTHNGSRPSLNKNDH
jgi:RHS repeat-associated protein